MEIIIVGTGSVGELLTKYIVEEGHYVTIIDRDAFVVKRVTDKYDANGVVGNGTCKEILLKAGAAMADLIIAAMSLDENNILCCDIAKKLGTKKTMARVRTPEYISDERFMREQLGVDMIVNPEYDCAHAIADNIHFPSNVKVEAFAGGKIDMTQLKIEAGDGLEGLSLAQMKRKLSTLVLVVAVKRGEKVWIPNGDCRLEKEDEITIIGSHLEIYNFLNKLGLIQKSVRSVLITGCQKITLYLVEMLNASGIHCKIIAANRRDCLELSERFPATDVIYGESMDSELLKNERLEKCDACITLTRSDKANLAVALYARSKQITNIIVLLNNLAFATLLHGLDINFTISSHYIMLEGVLRYIRGLASSNEEQGIKTLYKVYDNRVEALEFDVPDDFAKIGIPLKSKEFGLKKDTMIASIVRNQEVITPDGRCSLRAKDRIVVVTANQRLGALEDIIEHR